MPTLLDDFDPSVGSGTINTGSYAPCDKLRIYNESFYSLVLTGQLSAQQWIIPAWTMRTVQPREPEPYYRWKIRSTLNATNPPSSLCHVETYTKSEPFDGQWNMPLSRQANVGNAITVGQTDNVYNHSQLAGTPFIDAAPLSASGSRILIYNDGSIAFTFKPVLGGPYATLTIDAATGKVSLGDTGHGGITLDSGVNITANASFTSAVLLLAQLTTEQLRLGYDPTHYTSFTVDATGALTITDTAGHSVPISNVPQLTTAAANQFEVDDAATAAATRVLNLYHHTSGVAAANYGLDIRAVNDTNGGIQQAGILRWMWSDATDATRKGNFVVFVNDSASTRQVLNAGANGAAATIGFLGATPAARATGGAATAGAAYTATEQGMLQKVYDALRTFGFLT